MLGVREENLWYFHMECVIIESEHMAQMGENVKLLTCIWSA